MRSCRWSGAASAASGSTDSDYINLIEPMHPGRVDGPLVATTFHLSCYRDDPDGVQWALDEEVMQQRARREHAREQ